MSKSKENRLRLAKEIRVNGVLSPTSCDRCFCLGAECYVMPERLKCSECVRIGRPCVNLSWESLDRTREEYRKRVKEGEEELARVIAKLLRDKTILQQAEERARRKAVCLMDEMSGNGELEEPPESTDNCPASSALMGLSPSMWESLAAIEQHSMPTVQDSQNG